MRKALCVSYFTARTFEEDSVSGLLKGGTSLHCKQESEKVGQ